MWILRALGWGMQGFQKFQRLCLRHYLLGRLGQAGDQISLGEGFQLHGSRHIRLGNQVSIGNHVTLRALTVYPWTTPPQVFSPELILQDRCFINNFTQISCANRVVIGADVLIAEHCYIADHNHGYEDPAVSVRAQPLVTNGEVQIGQGSWIGTGCCIVGNVRIGVHCVVGAHSVVSADLPDFSVAVGAPARIIKRFDPQQGAWTKV